MKRIGVSLAALAAGLFLVGEGQSGDTGTQTKFKLKLPQGWSQLKLSKEQRSSMETIQKSFTGKIAALKKQIETLRDQEYQDQVKLLTADQKTQLRRIYAKKSGLDAPPPEKKSESKDKKGG
jgi:hypothetical protein